MHSVKKKIPKDRIEQDTCSAVEDYLRESEQKYNNIKDDYLYLSSNKKNKYKMTSIKEISIIPILEDYNFIDIIARYIKSEKLYKSNIFLSEKEIPHNEYKTILEKNQINEINKEKEEISQNTEKVEILEDGSICIKNTTGNISPSLGEKLVEIKNSNNEDINKEIDQDILINSKLLISNDIKFLDENNNENEDKELTESNNNNIILNKSLPNFFKDNKEDIANINYNNCVYFSTSKKNKIKSKNNTVNNYDKDKNISNKKKIIRTNVRKKKLLKSEDKNNKNIFSKDSEDDKMIEKKNNCFIKEIQINNNNNYNELNYRRILFGDNFKEDDDIINQWKYLSNKYIKNYNNKLLSTNIQIITQNLKIQKILEQKNKSNNIQTKTNVIKNKNKDNSFNNNNSNDDQRRLSIKEDYNNIENIDIQDNIAQSINIIEYNHKNNCDKEFYFEPTNISYILQPPITNFNNTYEDTFEELNILCEESYSKIINDENSKKKKYQGDIESINEEMNESLEEQESNEDKTQNKINLSNKKNLSNDKSQNKKILSNKKNLFNNENTVNIKINKSNKDIKLNSPLIDKFKINFDISKLTSNFKEIEKIYIKQNEFEIKDIESLSYSPISATSSNIKFPKKKEKIITNFNINNNNNNNFKENNNYNLSEIDNEEISVSKETETEMSDEEIILDSNGKVINNKNNSLINNYLVYKIEKDNNNDKSKIKLIFGNSDINENKNKRYTINIKSYKKIIKMIFYKKRKPVNKKSYESLISIIINNFSIFKREYSLKKLKKNYNKQEKEKINNNCNDMNNKILELEDKVKELKNCYIYGLVKKKLIKDKLEKKKFVKSLNIPEKRNKIKNIYKEIINILNVKINDGEINSQYYQKMIKILKNYDKISDKDLKEEIKEGIKYKNNNNEIINNSNSNNNKIINNNKKKIFIILLPMMFIINYFANNFKISGYNDLI